MKPVLAGGEPLELTEDNVLEFITDRKYITFVELARYFKGFEGDCQFGQIDNNLIFWVKMSEEICEILTTLDRAGKIYCKATGYLTYLIDGGCLQWPLAKRLNFKYKAPHWLPVVWNPASQLVHETVEFREAYAAYMKELSKNG